jgi:hypothetical protein
MMIEISSQGPTHICMRSERSLLSLSDEGALLEFFSIAQVLAYSALFEMLRHSSRNAVG